MHNPPTWTFLHPKATIEHLGFIPSFLDLDDPSDAAEQIHRNYVSGWNAFTGFKRTSPDPECYDIQYPGDPVYHAVAFTNLRDEVIVFYEHEWVGIFQIDGSFEVARLD